MKWWIMGRSIQSDLWSRKPCVGSILFLGSLFHMVATRVPFFSVSPYTLVVTDSESVTMPVSQRPPRPALVQTESSLMAGTMDLTAKKKQWCLMSWNWEDRTSMRKWTPMSQMFPGKLKWPLWLAQYYKKNILLLMLKTLKFHVNYLDLGLKWEGLLRTF